MSCLERAPHLMQQFHQFARAEEQLMHAAQIGLDAADGQAQAGAQIGDQAGDPHADASLTEHLAGQIELGAVPAPAVRTEAFDDPMLNHLNRLRFGQLDHLT